MPARETGTLQVHLRYATDLKEVEWWGRQDPYAMLKCGRVRHKSKTHQDGGKNPSWNEKFDFPEVHADCSLVIELFDKNVLRRDEMIGTCTVPLLKVCESGTEDVQAPVWRRKDKKRGTLSLLLKFYPGPQPKGLPPPPPTPRPEWIYKETEGVEEHYTLSSVLGRGTFGTTTLATSRRSAQQYACKTISKRKLNSIEEVEDVRREIQIMHHLAGHPNVVKIKGVYETRSDVHIVMELCTGGELFDRISKRKRYTEKDAADVIRTIVSVVAHCHNMGVMHRDLKPENFLLLDSGPDGVLKATDFGLGVFFQEEEVFNDVVGSPFYIAPEVLRRKYSKEADIWSCGVILYILLSGVPPFFAETERQIFERILQGSVDMTSEPWPRISDAAKDCVRHMLMSDPKRRASAAQILQHPWMKENGVATDNELELEVLRRMRNFAAGNKMKKEALMVIARSLPMEEIAGLQALFREFDKDGNNTITVDEFRKGLKKKGMFIAESDLQRLMEDADVNGDGNIDYEEFVAATMNMAKLEREEHLMRAFQHFDQDNNGFISKEELVEVLRDPNLHISNIEEILEDADTDGNGQIDYQEFTRMMRCRQPGVA